MRSRAAWAAAASRSAAPMRLSSSSAGPSLACRCWDWPIPLSTSATVLRPSADHRPYEPEPLKRLRRLTMEVILLERVAKLGQMGDVVRVKDGFARNFLLPKGKALRATDENRSRFETMKVDLEAQNLERRSEAQKVAEKLDGQSFIVIRQAAEGGQLYGSVTPRDIAVLVIERGFAVNRGQIVLNMPIKNIGLHKVPVTLHPEVDVSIKVAVARSADEAARLERGEDITVARDEGEEEAAATVAAAEAFFEPEVLDAQRAQDAEADESAPDGKRKA